MDHVTSFYLTITMNFAVKNSDNIFWCISIAHQLITDHVFCFHNLFSIYMEYVHSWPFKFWPCLIRFHYSFHEFYEQFLRILNLFYYTWLLEMKLLHVSLQNILVSICSQPTRGWSARDKNIRIAMKSSKLLTSMAVRAVFIVLMIVTCV